MLFPSDSEINTLSLHNLHDLEYINDFPKSLHSISIQKTSEKLDTIPEFSSNKYKILLNETRIKTLPSLPKCIDKIHFEHCDFIGNQQIIIPDNTNTVFIKK
ncbi:MAG TPA: hypothetical protein V6C58_10165 [Allocoleopsis sp.]